MIGKGGTVSYCRATEAARKLPFIGSMLPLIRSIASIRYAIVGNVRAVYSKAHWRCPLDMTSRIPRNSLKSYSVCLDCILDKNAIGEKVCRACYWRKWCRGEEDILYTNGMSLVEAKRRLVAAGLEEAYVDMSEAEARALARKNGYELVELLQGARPGEQLLVVRGVSCGRQTVERVGDVGFGCTCAKLKK